MKFNPVDLAGNQCCCRYQKDYIAHADSRSESATLECIKFYIDGRIRFEQHCYGEAACCIFTLWATAIDDDGTIHWDFPSKGYYDPNVLPHTLQHIDANGWLYFDDSRLPWKLSADLSSDPSAGYTKAKLLMHRLLHHQ